MSYEGEVEELVKALKKLISNCTIPEYLNDTIELLKKYEVK